MAYFCELDEDDCTAYGWAVVSIYITTIEISLSVLQRLPFSTYWTDVRKETVLKKEGVLELSALRMSGMYSLEDWTFINNWHAKNLKGTLKALKGIGS